MERPRQWHVPELLTRQVYRTPFIVYTLALFVVCLTLAVALYALIINSQVSQMRQETQRSFAYAQNTIAQNIQKVDNYFLTLYSDYNLPEQQDFMRFFGNNAETYMTLRLNETTSYNAGSFLENIKNFVSSNRYAIRRISFVAPDNANVIRYEETGNSQISFRMPHNAVGVEHDISDGYVYTRKLLRPGRQSAVLGDVSFLISADTIFEDLKNNTAIDSAVMSAGGALYYTADSTVIPQFQAIYEGANNEGILGSGLLGMLHYATFTSDRYGFKVISTISNRQIVSQNSALFVVVILGTLFIFVSITMLIATRMNYDARALNRIMAVIDQAKSGHFSAIELGIRKDEFGIIAQNLNDMSMQLREHIHREYILRLRQIEADMRTLQQQINPHFLYNTLEVIRSCALINRDDNVADAIYNLGGMFRDMIKGGDEVQLKTEINILSKYLKIMEFKFSDKFFYQIDISPETLERKTIKFWMQPLVENFFVHGFDRASDFNLLLIRERPYEDGVCIEFTDNGAQIPEARLEDINTGLSELAMHGTSSGGIGLKNVYARLLYYYGEHMKMGIRNNEEAGVTVFVVLPKEVERVQTVDRG